MPLDPDDSRPPYRQIADELRAAIRAGELVAGEKLPSTNELADQYGAAVNTVRSAVRLLREEGLVVARQGSGVFVRSDVQAEAELPAADEVRALTKELAAVARNVQRLSDRVAELEALVRRPSSPR